MDPLPLSSSYFTTPLAVRCAPLVSSFSLTSSHLLMHSMFDLGEEFTLENYRIPWLIWIQLIVLFLLLLVLFCFTIFPLDPADDSTAATTAPATASTFLFHDIQPVENEKPLAMNDSTATVVTSRRRHTQGGQNLSLESEIATCASLRREDVTEGEASPLFFYLRHYFQLATVAFLKCFGLDSASDGPSTRRHRKRKES